MEIFCCVVSCDCEFVWRPCIDDSALQLSSREAKFSMGNKFVIYLLHALVSGYLHNLLTKQLNSLRAK